MPKNKRKISDGYYKFDEERYFSEGCRAVMTIDLIDGEELDTEIEITGEFAVCGANRSEFLDKLGQLIDEYRI